MFYSNTDDKIYTYMMELIALMACHYIETFELEMYLNLFKTNNPPLVRKSFKLHLHFIEYNFSMFIWF